MGFAVSHRIETDKGTGLTHNAAAQRRNAARPSTETRIVGKAVEALSKETWTDPKRTREIRLEETLAPYSAQVGEIARIPRDQFGPGARVGTVDTPEGQEGAVVLYCLATSSREDAPRGMGFLYAVNRFNVEVCRARGLGVLVCSPDLLRVGCRSTPTCASPSPSAASMASHASHGRREATNRRGRHVPLSRGGTA